MFEVRLFYYLYKLIWFSDHRKKKSFHSNLELQFSTLKAFNKCSTMMTLHSRRIIVDRLQLLHVVSQQILILIIIIIINLVFQVIYLIMQQVSYQRIGIICHHHHHNRIPAKVFHTITFHDYYY